jgi:hypothetical protein
MGFSLDIAYSECTTNSDCGECYTCEYECLKYNDTHEPRHCEEDRHFCKYQSGCKPKSPSMSEYARGVPGINGKKITLNGKDIIATYGEECLFAKKFGNYAIIYRGKTQNNGVKCNNAAPIYWRPIGSTNINDINKPSGTGGVDNYFSDVSGFSNSLNWGNIEGQYYLKNPRLNLNLRDAIYTTTSKLGHPFLLEDKDFVSEGDCYCGYYYIHSTASGNELITDSCYSKTQVDANPLNPLMHLAGTDSYHVECKIGDDGFYDSYEIIKRVHYDNCANSGNVEKYKKGIYPMNIKGDKIQDYWNVFGPCGYLCDFDVPSGEIQREELPSETVNCLEGIFEDDPKSLVEASIKVCSEMTLLDEVCRFPLICVDDEGNPRDPDCLVSSKQLANHSLSRNVDSNLDDGEYGLNRYCEKLNDELGYGMDCDGVVNNFACGYGFNDAGEISDMRINASGIYSSQGIYGDKQKLCIKNYLTNYSELSTEEEEYSWQNLTEDKIYYFSIKDENFVSSGILINFLESNVLLSNELFDEEIEILDKPIVLLCSNANLNFNPNNDSYSYPSFACDKNLSVLSVCFNPNFFRDDNLNIVNLGSDFLYPGDSILINDSLKICDYGVSSLFVDAGVKNFDDIELLYETYFLDSYDVLSSEISAKEKIGGSSCYYKARNFNSVYSGYSIMTSNGLECCGDDGILDNFEGEFFNCVRGKTVFNAETMHETVIGDFDLNNPYFSSAGFLNETNDLLTPENILNYPDFININQNNPFNLLVLEDQVMVCNAQNNNLILHDIYQGDIKQSSYWFCSYSNIKGEYFFRDIYLNGFNNSLEDCSLDSISFYDSDLDEFSKKDNLILTNNNLNDESSFFSELSLLQKNFVSEATDLNILTEVSLSSNTKKISVSEQKEFKNEIISGSGCGCGGAGYDLKDGVLVSNTEEEFSLNIGIPGSCLENGDYCKDNSTLIKYFVSDNKCSNMTIDCTEYGFLGCDFGVCAGCVHDSCKHILNCDSETGVCDTLQDANEGEEEEEEGCYGLNEFLPLSATGSCCDELTLCSNSAIESKLKGVCLDECSKLNPVKCTSKTPNVMCDGIWLINESGECEYSCVDSFQE